MTETEAYDLLIAHAGASPSPDHPTLGTGFLGMLRPYGGLREENFHEVMLALRTVAPSLQAATVNRELIVALWGICHFGRAWALEKDGMLQSNNLISPTDANRLDEWLSMISYAVVCLLEDAGESEAFFPYSSYQSSATDSGPASS
jgi:hypothetical protein